MNPSSDRATTGIGRREALRRAALIAGAAFSPAWLSFVDRARPLYAQAVHLTTPRLALVTAIADRILPRTDTPGASDVGVPMFIDALYGEFMTPEERQMLTAGLDAVDAESQARHRTSFGTLSAAQQDDILRAIARAEEGQPSGPFRLFRSATVLGYFTSEQVGRNVLNYDPVPGRFDACIPISEVGRRNWTT